MKPKNLVTILLLLFVAASVGVLSVKSLRPHARQPVATNPTLNHSAGQTEATPPADGVIAYCFHGDVRCSTCRTIEAYAREALEAGFADQFQSGKLKWQVVNYQAPGNEHFAKEYEIIAPTVVLVRMENGQQKNWENLMRVWELVHDKDAFVQYIQTEMRKLDEVRNGVADHRGEK